MKEATRIVFTLDRTGSMEPLRAETIGMVNEFIKKQKELPGDCWFRLALFDTPAETMDYEVVRDGPIREVKELELEEYMPRGMTPLHDAMARSILGLGKELEALPEDQRPNKVLVVTLTDGLENNSHEHTQESVAKMVKHQQEKYNWEFVFLGANQDAVLTAQNLNIPARAALTYDASAAGYAGTAAALNIYAKSVRSVLGGVTTSARNKLAFSDSDRKKAKQ